MQHAILELLLPALFAATPTRAPEPATRPATSPRSLEIEIVEKPASGKSTRTRMELPANAKLEARVAKDGADGRICTVQSHHDRGETSIELRCRERGMPDALAIEAHASLALGKRATLAKIDRPDGGSVEVTAVWR